VWGEERCIEDFGGKPEGKRPLGKPIHRYDNNTRMELQELVWVDGPD